jgi:hypothetical protein
MTRSCRGLLMPETTIAGWRKSLTTMSSDADYVIIGALNLARRDRVKLETASTNYVSGNLPL